MNRPQVNEDAVLLQAMGTDPEAWASSYLKVAHNVPEGDARLHLTANWFKAAMLAGAGEERERGFADGPFEPIETPQTRWNRLLDSFRTCDEIEKHAVLAGEPYEAETLATHEAFKLLMAAEAPTHAAANEKLRVLLEYHAGSSFDDRKFDPIMEDIERLGALAGEQA